MGAPTGSFEVRMPTWPREASSRISSAAPPIPTSTDGSGAPAPSRRQAANTAAWAYFRRRLAAGTGEQPVTEQVGPGQPQLIVRIEPAQRIGAVARWVAPPSTKVENAPVLQVEPGSYVAYLPELAKGTRIRYWITVRNVEQTVVRIPEKSNDLITLKYKDAASTWVIVAHIAFMFGAFFFMILALLGSIRMLRGLEGKRSTVNAARWVLILCFIGTWPLGLALNYQTFGVLWQGFPFGSDVTDNKTQAMFLFWLVCLLLACQGR